MALPGENKDVRLEAIQLSLVPIMLAAGDLMEAGPPTN